MEQDKIQYTFQVSISCEVCDHFNTTVITAEKGRFICLGCRNCKGTTIPFYFRDVIHQSFNQDDLHISVLQVVTDAEEHEVSDTEQLKRRMVLCSE